MPTFVEYVRKALAKLELNGDFVSGIKKFKSWKSLF